jgi:hypothetical protein
MQEAEKHKILSWYILRKKKRFLSYPSVMSHLIDVEPPCLREATREQVWKDAITEEYQYILKNDV